MSQIELITVQSTRIAAIGYRGEDSTLAIRFSPTKNAPTGRIYHYKGFSSEQWNDFRSSESLGGYFSKHILNNPQHPYSCIDDGAARPQAKAEGPTAKEGKLIDSSGLTADATDLKTRALAISAQAKGLAIYSFVEFAEAGKRLKQIVLEKKQAQQRINQIKAPAYQAYKATLQLEKDVITPYSQAEQWIKSGMARYLTEEESQRRKKEASLSAEALRLAEEEARHIAAEFAESDAQMLESQGEMERAAQARQNPLPVIPARIPPVVLQKEIPKIDGVSSRKNWSFRVVDESQLPREYLMANEAAIRQVVRALKDKSNIPGVEVYCEDSVAVRA